MDNLLENITKADSGDVEAQLNVARYILWDDYSEEIDPDWLVRAISYLESAATQGNCDAMLELGFIYRDGRGVDRSIDESFRWNKMAADLLNPAAFCNMGYALEIPLGYLDPNDEKADYKTAFEYFLKGALLGDANCLYKLGDMYFSGKYVDADPKFAFMLYRDSRYAAGNIYSYSGACLRLGECYLKGIGTEQDVQQARECLKDAISSYKRGTEGGELKKFTSGGHDRAIYLLKEIDSGKEIEAVPNQGLKDDSEDYIEFISSALMEYPEPEYPIAELDSLKAENPCITDFDKKMFFNGELSAAEAGNVDAMYHIAFYCFNRFDDSSDREMIGFALYYYHKAIRQGCRACMYNLGAIYFHGDGGVEIDKKKAFLLYYHASAFIAQGELGFFYAMGEIIEKDYEKAFKCFAKSALQLVNASFDSLANLATMYRKGLYVAVDAKFADYLDDLSKKAEKNIDKPGAKI